jgi:hypothetical protein
LARRFPRRSLRLLRGAPTRPLDAPVGEQRRRLHRPLLGAGEVLRVAVGAAAGGALRGAE